MSRFFLIAGPCAIENREMVLLTAATLKEVCDKLSIRLIFKSSFDKANRTSSSSKRGVGINEGLAILKEVKQKYSLPILTDVHETWQCERVAEVADVLQIPAFLSRQTDLIEAAARTGKIVNVKKGQFMAPWDMRGVVDKVENVVGSHDRLWLTERGSSFGYGNLVVDMTSLVEMHKMGCPVVFDATHAVQKPSSQTGITAGNREMVPHLMRAALAVGIDGLFLEVHPDPDNAISDAANQVALANIENILKQAIIIDDASKASIAFQSSTFNLRPSTFNPKPSSFLSDIALLLTDVDGVLTDGGMYYANSGDELKRFNTRDGMGLQLLQRQGVKVGLLTSESVSLLERRAAKLQLDYAVIGKRNGGKLEAAKDICKQLGITLLQTAYIGDDVNCRELLEKVGYAACPADAADEVKQISGIHILTKKGGEGCVRELCEQIIKAKQK